MPQGDNNTFQYLVDELENFDAIDIGTRARIRNGMFLDTTTADIVQNEITVNDVYNWPNWRIENPADYITYTVDNRNNIVLGSDPLLKPNKIKPLKKTIITEDDTTKNMANLKELTKQEKNQALCIDILVYYKKNIKEDLAGLYPINEIVKIRNNDINNTAVVLGYIYNNSIYKTQKELIIDMPNPNNIKYLVGYYKKDMKKISFLIIENNYKNIASGVSNSDKKELISKLPIKINSAELSSNVFGFGKIKRQLINSIYNDYEINSGLSKKIGESTYYISIPYEGKNIKFCISDTEFVLPNINGFNIPINKTFKINDTIIIARDKNEKNINKELIITSIKINKSSKRIGKNSNNRQLDIITGVDCDSNIIRSYAKNLKLVKSTNNDIKEEIKSKKSEEFHFINLEF